MLLNLLQGTTEPPQRGPTQLHWQPSRIRDHVLGQGPTTVLYTRTAEHYVCTYQPASAISGRLVSTYRGPQLGPSVLDIRSAPAVCQALHLATNSHWKQRLPSPREVLDPVRDSLPSATVLMSTHRHRRGTPRTAGRRHRPRHSWDGPQPLGPGGELSKDGRGVSPREPSKNNQTGLCKECVAEWKMATWFLLLLSCQGKSNPCSTRFQREQPPFHTASPWLPHHAILGGGAPAGPYQSRFYQSYSYSEHILLI